MMDNLYLISFGMGLALFGLWRVGWSARELACSRQRRLSTWPPRKSDRCKCVSNLTDV